MEILVAIGLILFFSFIVACVIMLIKINIPRYCEHCHKRMEPDHWCEEKIEHLKAQQTGRKWDGKSRRIYVRYECRVCYKTVNEYVIFDYKSDLPDKTIFLKSVCREHNGKAF